MTGYSPEVAVLLCTYNGNRFLSSQLESLLNQAAVSVSLTASDDGSTDNTVQILRDCSRHNRQIIDLRQGPRAGAAQNFLSLICDKNISANYFAYADQDDIWDEDKLSRAVSALAECHPNRPALYCARTRSLSASGEISGCSPLFCRSPSFANALVHNIGGGNTMVMNRASRELLCRGGNVDVVSHDWWTYLLVSGAGGTVIYDPEPCLDYRQHSANQIGANTGIKRRASRYLEALNGRNRDWNSRNISALEQNAALLTPDNQQRLRSFSQSRHGGLLTRFRGIRRAGLYAQTFSGNLGLFFATLLKKI
ncbi:MAG: glycosyltransferase family 2 protein [Halioglobus sp.]